MNEQIEKLFSDALAKFGKNIPTGTKEVFEKLIKQTLEYRDKLASQGEPPLTIAEVNKALNIFQKTLETGAFPKDIPNRLLPLLENWITSFV